MVLTRLEAFNYWQRSAIIAVVSLLLAGLCEYTEVFRRFDNTIADAHAQLLAPAVSFSNLVIIDVDEDTIARLQPALGAWPYEREVFGLITDYLLRAGVRAIAYDIVFSEGRKGDAEFAATLDARVVLAAADLENSLRRDAAYNKMLAEKSWPSDAGFAGERRRDITLPRAALLALARAGVISAPTDSDGVLRRVPLRHIVEGVEGRALPSLPLALLYADVAPPPLATRAGKISAGASAWPVNANGQVALRFPSNL